MKLHILKSTPDILVLLDRERSNVSTFHMRHKTYYVGNMESDSSDIYAFGYWRVWKGQLEFRHLRDDNDMEQGDLLLGEKWKLHKWLSWSRGDEDITALYTKYVQEWLADRAIERYLAAGPE